MASGKSQYLQRAVLDYLIGQATALPQAATLYLALSTQPWSASATGDACDEVPSDNAYARVAVINSSAGWAAATGVSPAEKTNVAEVDFPVAGGAWGTAVSFYLCDAATGGNIYYGGDLVNSRVIVAGNSPSFAPGDLIFRES